MEDSAYDAIYIGVYVFIFVIALSLSVFLFRSVYNYSELSYQYTTKSVDKSVIINAPISKYNLINGSEVLDYFYNYIKRDNYGTSKAPIDYKLDIIKGGNIKFSSDYVNNNTNGQNDMNMYQISDNIKPDSKYYIDYIYESSGYVHISIIEATQEQINATY